MVDFASVRAVTVDVLSSVEAARSNDMVLYVHVLKRLGWVLEPHKFGLSLVIPDLYAMPPFESYSRMRRKLQSEGLFLPDQRTLSVRVDCEEDFREYYGSC